MTSVPSVPQFTDARRTRPGWLRPLNAAGRLLPRVARPSADHWLAQAMKKARVDAQPEPEVVQALGVLADALDREADLSLLGRFSAQQDTVRMLVNHLRVRAHVAAHPEVDEVELPDPVFIVGIPRSGTTFMHHLLAHDPAHRVLPYWESFKPLPPATGPDDREARVDAMLRQLAVLAPNYQAIHPMSGDAPEECVALFMNVVRTLQMDIQYRVPAYTSWLLGQDPAIAYRAYAEQLRVVHSLRPTGTRFVLKDPAHTFHLDTVLAQFPGAKVVFLHRTPVDTVSSICSLYAHTRALFSDAVNPTSLGPEVLGGHWPKALDRMMAVRAGLPEGSYVDVLQGDLARDPLGAASAVYDRLGFELTDEAATSMRAFADGGLPEFRRRHEHSLDGFGLTEARVRERFGTYLSEIDL